jgi:hypothetical protein
MYRYSDLEVVKLHIQDLYAEADRNSLIKQSGLWEERRKNRWDVRLLSSIVALLARWSCILQGQFSQSIFPGLSRISFNQDPCLCAPQACTD